MVNRVLQDYVRALRHRMLHVPLRVQRRITNEVVAHIEADVQQLRVEHGEWSTEQATQEAIDKLCPADEAIPVFGPEEGIIRRSSADWVVRGKPPKTKATPSDGRRWGAAAAAIAVVTAGVAVLAIIADPAEQPAGLGVESAEGHAWAFANATGAFDLHVLMPAGDITLEVTSADAGCITVRALDPDSVAHQTAHCFTGSLTVEGASAGEWTMQISLDGFYGALEMHTA